MNEMKGMTCGNCGYKTRENIVICPECGVELIKEKEENDTLIDQIGMELEIQEFLEQYNHEIEELEIMRELENMNVPNLVKKFKK
jgi:hypothetical protein